jgi:hypothetical protein
VKDSGSITASGGTLTFTGPVSGTGTLTVGASSTLELRGGATGGAINFDSSGTLKIDGDGNSTITCGSGSDNITITGDGANNITIGKGTDDVTITGTGANTIAAGTSAAGITITGFSGSLAGSAPSPSPGATITLNGADNGNATIGSNSTLEVANGATFAGTIDFGSTSGGTLKIDGATMPAAVIKGFNAGDTIDFSATPATSISGGDLIQSPTNLTLSTGALSTGINLNSRGNYYDYAISRDKKGGVLS